MNKLPSVDAPLNLYGSLAPVIEGIRAQAPFDLNSVRWREQHPGGLYEEWQQLAQSCLRDSLHYDPGPVDLKPTVNKRIDRGDYILEEVSFSATAWHRLDAYVLLPKVDYPAPAVVVLHAWGGPMCFGKDRVVNSGRDHDVLIGHRERNYDGKYLAEEYVRQGYVVMVIDAHHFGERMPKGIADIALDIDPYDLTVAEHEQLQQQLRNCLYLGVRQLNWAGTTWAGLNYYDDVRCVDYLQSRPEVDADRIGVTGLSGGGWRCNMLAALEPRIRASVSVGWMTTCALQQDYNIEGAIGTFCLLPGAWNRLDIPDMASMSAHAACMVVVGQQDILFPKEAKAAAREQIESAFAWAGRAEACHYFEPNAPHCYNSEVQAEAFSWFDRHLRS